MPTTPCSLFSTLWHRSESDLSGCTHAFVLIIHVKLLPHLKHALNESCNDQNDISKFGEGRSEKGEDRRSCYASDDSRQNVISMEQGLVEILFRSYGRFWFEMEWHSRQISQLFVWFVLIKMAKTNQRLQQGRRFFLHIDAREIHRESEWECIRRRSSQVRILEPLETMMRTLRTAENSEIILIYMYFVFPQYPSLSDRIYPQQNEKDKS